jgi:4'-phosphopantetheinyl transferase
VNSRYSLPFGEVHVWRYALSQSDRSLSKIRLSSEEQEKLLGFHQERDRLMRSAAWRMMRLVLSRYLGVDSQHVCIDRSAEGRPYLKPEAELDFNLSHTADAALLAVSRRRRVGIDIETCANASKFDRDLIGGAFSVEEQRILEKVSNAERPIWALQWWTRKEAVLKAIGIGLGFPIRHIEVAGFSPGPQSCSIDMEQVKMKFNVFDLELSCGWRASVAIKDEIGPIRYFCLGWPREPQHFECFTNAGLFGPNNLNASMHWLSVS